MKKQIFFLVCFFFVMGNASAQILDAGPDMTICPGEIVRLQGIGDSSHYFYYRWSPDSSIYGSTTLNPWVWPSVTTTYYLYGYWADSNIVVNGDFELGNSGFTSSYIYATGSSGLWPEGTYSVVNHAYQVHPNFPQTYDHTFGTISGHYMAVNGSGVPNTTVWEQTLLVQPNTDYIFYTWVLTLVASNQSELAQLQFSINGNLVGSVFNAPYPASNGWQQFYTIWNSGASTNATITIVNQNITYSGNDFGLDDIYFAPIVPDSDSVTVFIQDAVTTYQTVKQCANTSYVFNRHIIVESGIYIDTVQTSEGCDSILVLDITFYPPVEVDLGDDLKFCKMDTASVFLDPGTGYDAYLWNNGDSTRKIEVSYSGTYSVTVANEIGCTATDEIDVNFVNPPQLEIINNTENFCDDFSASLSLNTNAFYFLWSNGEITPEIEVHEFGTISVIVSDESDFFCSAYDTVTIDFCCPDNLKLPNVITPSDHNDINDYFEFIESMPYQKLEINIYNRWGRVVYNSKDPAFRWDGMVDGKLETGIFYYVLDLKNGCEFHGTITIF